jgi:hypothetical protein
VTVREPRAGDLLVASVLLADGVFNQTVVLLLDLDEDGALGVILNEISQLPLDSGTGMVNAVSGRTCSSTGVGLAERCHLLGQRGHRRGGAARLAAPVRHGGLLHLTP